VERATTESICVLRSPGASIENMVECLRTLVDDGNARGPIELLRRG
jgi:hypothetical protein